MKNENITNIATLATKLNLEYKILEKIIKKGKTPSPNEGYKILKDLNVPDETLEEFFKTTYGAGNDAYLEMMRRKLDSYYEKAKNTNE